MTEQAAPISYDSAGFAVRPDLAVAHQEFFDQVSRPGAWWTGIFSSDTRAELGIDAFGSSANTPPPGVARRVVGAVLRPVAVKLMARISKRMRSS